MNLTIRRSITDDVGDIILRNVVRVSCRDLILKDVGEGLPEDLLLITNAEIRIESAAYTQQLKDGAGLNVYIGGEG